MHRLRAENWLLSAFILIICVQKFFFRQPASFLPLGADLEFQVEITGTSTITPGLILTRYLRLRDFYTADELLFVAYFACGPNLFAVRAQDSVGNVEPVAHGENGVETAVDCYIHLPAIPKP